MRFNKFDERSNTPIVIHGVPSSDLAKEVIEHNQNIVSAAIIKHRIETKGCVDPMDFGCIPDSIAIAKESVRRKEETRMVRAKND